MEVYEEREEEEGAEEVGVDVDCAALDRRSAGRSREGRRTGFIVEVGERGEGFPE
jgi:hypothetical protein